jgi:hypothetical protein
MHSHYAQEATSYANMQLSVHARINDLHRRAHGIAPTVEESALDSGCTDGPGSSRAEYKALGPRQRMAWDMVAEAHGWNAISDNPAMLAVAEQCERDGQPYYVGYENTKPAQFTTPLALDESGDMFTWGVWGPDQPMELLPADAAREVAETNALIDEISERHGLSTEPASPAQPESCGCWNATHLGSCIHQPSDPWSAADLAASNAAQPQRAPWAVAEDFPQRASYTPAQLQCCGTWIDYPQAGGATECLTCHTTFLVTAPCPDELVSCEECSAPCDGTLTAYSELMGEDVPVCPNCRAMCALLDAVAVPVPSEAEVLAVAVTLTLSDNAAGCPVHGADPCFCAELLSDSGCVCRLGPDCPIPGSCSASAIAEAEDATSGRHAGELWDIPSDYTGRHRNTDAAIDDAWLQRL